jgi:hypothetical protein
VVRIDSASQNVDRKGVKLRFAIVLERETGKIEEIIARKRVDTELLVLRDYNGRERAKLGVANTDSACLSLPISQELKG